MASSAFWAWSPLVLLWRILSLSFKSAPAFLSSAPCHPTPKINSSPWTMEDGWPLCSFNWLKSFPLCCESIHVKLFLSAGLRIQPHALESQPCDGRAFLFLAAFHRPRRCLVHSCISGLRWRIASWGDLAVDVAASVCMWILTCNHHNHESCHSSRAWPPGPYYTTCVADNTILILQLWRLRFRGKEWLKQSHGVSSHRGDFNLGLLDSRAQAGSSIRQQLMKSLPCARRLVMWVRKRSAARSIHSVEEIDNW